MKIQIRRVYESPKPSDGLRVLVDRLWPRGLSREAAAVELWAKDLAPSDGLRRWFGHEPEKFDEFRRRFYSELDHCVEQADDVYSLARGRTITLVYAAKDTERNNAAVLRAWLQGDDEPSEARLGSRTLERIEQ